MQVIAQPPTGRNQHTLINMQSKPRFNEEEHKLNEAFKKCLSCGAPVFTDPDENGLPCGH